MSKVKKETDYLLYIVVIISTLLSLILLCSFENNVYSFKQENEKYNNDKNKDNYINLKQVLNIDSPVKDLINIESLSDFQMDLKWGTHPGKFNLLFFNPTASDKGLIDIPKKAKKLKIELFASSTYSFPLDIVFSQFDDKGLIKSGKYRVTLPFSIAQYRREQDFATAYSLNYDINPQTKYYQVSIRAYSYHDDDSLHLGYVDLNWK